MWVSFHFPLPLFFASRSLPLLSLCLSSLCVCQNNNKSNWTQQTVQLCSALPSLWLSLSLSYLSLNAARIRRENKENEIEHELESVTCVVLSRDAALLLRLFIEPLWSCSCCRWPWGHVTPRNPLSKQVAGDAFFVYPKVSLGLGSMSCCLTVAYDTQSMSIKLVSQWTYLRRSIRFSDRNSSLNSIYSLPWTTRTC